MPINMMINILGSVGAGGKNQLADVRAVQTQLNGLMNPPRRPLTVDGKSGPKTETMIRDFQRSVCGFRRGDGRVDPGGKTLTALNQPMSEGKWAGMSMMPDDARPSTPAAPVAGGADGPLSIPAGRLTPAEATLLQQLAKGMLGTAQVKSDPQTKAAVEGWLDAFVKGPLQDIKALLTSGGFVMEIVQKAKFAEIANTLRTLHQLKFGNWEATVTAIASISKGRSAGSILRGFAAMGQSQKIANAFSKAGNVMIALGIIVAVVEAKNHWDKGDYGAAFKELYKCFMGIGVPLAAVGDGIQSLVQYMYPNWTNAREGSAFFAFVKAFNVLDHGGNAVDAMVSIVQTCINSFKKGELDQVTLQRLVDRMRDSSASVFVALGEELGDAYYDATVEGGKKGEELGEYIGERWGADLLPIVKFFDL